MTKHNIVPLHPSVGDPLQDVLREGARKLLAQAIDTEVEELLEQHADRRTPEGRAGVVRNGYLPERELQTGLGPIDVRIPKVRAKVGEPVTFRSKLVPPYVRKAASLEAVLPWLYLKGISTGDMHEALTELVGEDAKGLSATTVARLKRKWADEYAAWRTRSLADRTWVYIWVDGIYSRIRGETGKLCVLVVIGVDDHGRKALLAVEEGVRESSQSWRELLMNLHKREMNVPQLAIGDGALGFWNALNEIWPDTRCQRCWMHKMSNVLNRLPKSSQAHAKRDMQEIWQAETKAKAEHAYASFKATYDAKYPNAVECLVKDRETLLTFYDFPAEHWRSIRTTNPIESTFGTIRHRTRQAKGCVSRQSALHMMFKLGCVAETHWRRLNGFEQLAEVVEGIQFIDGLKIKPPEETHPPTTQIAA